MSKRYVKGGTDRCKSPFVLPIANAEWPKIANDLKIVSKATTQDILDAIRDSRTI